MEEDELLKLRKEFKKLNKQVDDIVEAYFPQFQIC